MLIRFHGSPDLSAMKLTFEVAESGGWTVLRVAGEVDIATAGQLRQRLEDLTREPTKLALDLTKVGFMDSTGLGVLVATSRTLSKTGGSLAVVADQPALTKIFEITALGQVMHICPRVEDLPQA